jgi:hypothetical protein
MEEEVSKKVELFVNMLQKSAEKCEDQGEIYVVNNSYKYLITPYHVSYSCLFSFRIMLFTISMYNTHYIG